MKKKTNSEKYAVNYGSDSHEIDSKTLSCSLSKLTEVINEINCQLKNGKKIEIKVKTFENGSFEVKIEINQFMSGDDLFSPSESNIPEVLTVFKELIELLKFLGDKAPKEAVRGDDKTKVISVESQVLFVSNIVYDIFTSGKIASSAIREHFRSLDSDESILSFTLYDESRTPIIDIKRDDFKRVASIKDIPLEEKELLDRAHLSVFKIVFSKNHKWQFYYKGVEINVQIQDSSFLKKVELGEHFAQGDVLYVDLMIKQKFDTKVNAFVNVSYDIIRVIQHIPRAEQTKLHLE